MGLGENLKLYFCFKSAESNLFADKSNNLFVLA